ncbi:hypothetical protein ANOM_002068 [Aspergillus nomiae NRRL 13137]|uniref:Uncharacterized protein n=1 Tax=Aspergillus nomiae NRRL (strain ATCC 15546 / NRRL 13137 / CBS 260.88 / M93) TaxID=1509407 RepID=A0A0L1JE93_ASPN3|nr:uncharacterized protein ANOM_002068 [Aspergillus nomiae NRRL 13137]KNG90110.1 hypothetical protein ANOM_002068 [Aspergillus nomiae NRRL 13137]
MPRAQRARKRKQAVVDHDIAIHSDERSTAVVATTLNIASVSKMTVGSQRSLAECLETDDLYSGMVHDDMWTGNSMGLGIPRDNSTLRMLERKVAKMESARAADRAEDKRQYEATHRRLQEKISGLHYMIDVIGRQNHARYIVGYSQMRTRFISIFQRDILKIASSEDRVLIGRGNTAAHDGNFLADAKLYDMGFVAEDGTRFPPRNDCEVFEQLYGVLPSLAGVIKYTPTILVLEQHATIVSSTHMKTPIFKERFEAFIRSLAASNNASDYLDSDSPHLEEFRLTYNYFWDAVRTEVSRQEATGLEPGVAKGGFASQHHLES